MFFFPCCAVDAAMAKRLWFVKQPQPVSSSRSTQRKPPKPGQEAIQQIDGVRGKYVGTFRGALSNTPLCEEALLSPPARLPVDILFINLSRWSAFSQPLTPAAPSSLHEPQSLISHQSIKALSPLPPQALLSQTSWSLSPPSFFSLVIEQGPSALPRALQSCVSLFSRGLRGLCPCSGSLLYNDSPLY